MNAPRTDLRPASSSTFTDWVRRIFGRAAPRARVVAPSSVHLGQSLDVEWRLEHGAPDTTLVTVELVGTEIARRRISARSGISVVTQTRPFVIVEIDRQAPDRGAPVAGGRGEVIVPARFVPSVAGRLNEIAWAVVVEASVGAATSLRQEFPLAVLPVLR